MKKEKCKECKTKLLKITDFMPFSKKEQEKFEKEFGLPLPQPKGYVCPECGCCYDENYKLRDIKLMWLKNSITQKKEVKTK